MQLTTQTLGEVLTNLARNHADEIAIKYNDRDFQLTWSELNQAAEKLAKGWLKLGIKKGDHVAIWATNIPEWLLTLFSTAKIGAILVTVNTNYKSFELEYLLRQSDTKALVLMDGFKDADYIKILNEVCPELSCANDGMIKSSKFPYLEHILYAGNNLPDGMTHFDKLYEPGEEVSAEELNKVMHSLNCHDVINMQYTSGTTGFPKGVMLTHYNVINDARMVGDVMGMTSNDRLLIQVPLFHCFGCVMSSLNCIVHGSTMVMVEYFDPLKALQYIQDEKCTAINGVPTMFIAILGHEDFAKYDMSSLRTGIMAGAPCPVETMKQVTEKMHCPEVVIAFGQTECSPVMTMTRRDDPVDIRVSTVGRLLPGIQGKIIDPATGEDLPPNVQGEIVTKSPCVMKGYYKMPEETKKAIDEQGWLHTGDLGTVDEQGNFKVTGRIKEMIIRGGENIYPREIEEFLHKHPKVRDVYVVGVPDKKYGEQLLAVIIHESSDSLTKEELIEYCNGRIARHKIPKYWEFTSTVPMTASGKVQKYKIVEQYSSRYAS